MAGTVAGTVAGDGASGTGAGVMAGTVAGPAGSAGGVGGESGSAAGGGSGAPGPEPIDCTSAEVNAGDCEACGTPASCDAPTYTDNADGTVTSACCGLVWQQALEPDLMQWVDAHAHCESLSLAGGAPE